MDVLEKAQESFDTFLYGWFVVFDKMRALVALPPVPFLAVREVSQPWMFQLSVVVTTLLTAEKVRPEADFEKEKTTYSAVEAISDGFLPIGTVVFGAFA